MASTSLLALKWNNHKSTFLQILSTIRDKESYCDVTLACDGKFYPLHKFVLSTCSEYFEEMFERTTCKNPIIVLKDIKCDDLEALLNYMYIGEVNVEQEKLAGLIKAAECLKIKGLAAPDEELANPNIVDRACKRKETSNAFSDFVKRRREMSDYSNDASSEIVNSYPSLDFKNETLLNEHRNLSDENCIKIENIDVTENIVSEVNLEDLKQQTNVSLLPSDNISSLKLRQDGTISHSVGDILPSNSHNQEPIAWMKQSENVSHLPTNQENDSHKIRGVARSISSDAMVSLPQIFESATDNSNNSLRAQIILNEEALTQLYECDTSAKHAVYRCLVCLYSTLMKNHIENHVTAHTDLQPFKCHLCPFKCKYKKDLLEHSNLNHEVESAKQCK